MPKSEKSNPEEDNIRPNSIYCPPMNSAQIVNCDPYMQSRAIMIEPTSKKIVYINIDYLKKQSIANDE